MNALTTTGAALVPRDMREAMDLANVMAKAGFLAKELQTPGGAMFVIEQAMRWNMSPFSVAMETAFIQGKPFFSGKIVAAAVTSCGAVNGRLAYQYDGDGDGRRVTVIGTLRGEAEPRTVTVALRDAKTGNKVWITQPDQQLAYHGARVWARRHAPDAMLGVYSPEEMEDAPAPIPPARGPVMDMAPESPKPAGLPLIAPDGRLVEVPEAAWLRGVGRALGGLEDAAAVRAWRQAMGPHLGSIAEAGHDALAREADALIAARIEALSPGDDA